MSLVADYAQVQKSFERVWMEENPELFAIAYVEFFEDHCKDDFEITVSMVPNYLIMTAHRRGIQ